MCRYNFSFGQSKPTFSLDNGEVTKSHWFETDHYMGSQMPMSFITKWPFSFYGISYSLFVHPVHLCFLPLGYVGGI